MSDNAKGYQAQKMQERLTAVTLWIDNFRQRAAEPILRIHSDARFLGEFNNLSGAADVSVGSIKLASETLADDLFSGMSALATAMGDIRGWVYELEEDLKAAKDGIAWLRNDNNEKLQNAQNIIKSLKADAEIRRREHNPSSPEVRAKVLALTGGKCAYCCIPISDDPNDGTLTFAVEHLVAKDNGGPDHLSNFVPSCMPCNLKKRTAHVLEFIHFRLGVSHPEPVMEAPVSLPEFLEAAE